MFDYEKWQSIIQNYLDQEDEKIEEFFGEGASNENIIKAEERLDIIFPESYKIFLSRYGSGGIEGLNIMGIEQGREIDEYTVVYLTEQYRKKYEISRKWIVIEDVGEFIICLNAEKLTDLECPVISWAGHRGDDEEIKKADNFYIYLLEQLEEFSE